VILRGARKWRPTLAMIVTAMIGSALLLPLFGIVFFRLYEERLIQSTEAELIAQSAALAATTSQLLQDGGADDLPLGRPVPDTRDPNEPWNPTLPALELSGATVYGERPEARDPGQAIPPAYARAGERMQPILRNTQQHTLAGFRILDLNGTVIAGRDEVGRSLAHIEEIRGALSGRYTSTLRTRVIKNPQPVYSISRGTSIRIFTAMPVVVEGRVAGAVYASRTPSNILKELYAMRGKLALIGGVIVIAVGLMVGIFARAILNPIHKLTARAVRIGKGDRGAIEPLDHYGSREVYRLSNELFEMSDKLFARQDYINTFAAHVSHELKSPLTAIRGAAELLQENSGGMSEAKREKFLANILKDTERAGQLLDRLRQLAIAENPIQRGSVTLASIVEGLQRRFEDLSVAFTGKGALSIGIAPENAAIIFSNLTENAAHHGASTIRIEAERSGDEIVIHVADNGSGISPANAEKIFDLFFTTRRDAGGTGMGLGIIQAIVKAHGGTIRLKSSNAEHGTIFEIAVPADAGPR
jgi:signal transduction histidine kinase